MKPPFRVRIVHTLAPAEPGLRPVALPELRAVALLALVRLAPVLLSSRLEPRAPHDGSSCSNASRHSASVDTGRPLTSFTTSPGKTSLVPMDTDGRTSVTTTAGWWVQFPRLVRFS